MEKPRLYVLKDEFEGFYIDEIAKNYQSFSEEYKCYYLESFIDELGKDLTAGRKSIFLSKGRLFQIVATIIGITEDEILNKLKEIKSTLADKYAILGYYNGKRVYKSEISGQIKPILSKMTKKLSIDKTNEFLAMLDYLHDTLKVKVL